MDINITNPVTTAKIGQVVNGANAATPNDTDLLPIIETSVTKKITLTNFKAFLKTYFDTLYTGGGSVWGSITGTLSAQTDLQNALNNKEPLKGADDNYVTDAQLTVIQNTSGTNTGDQDLSGLQVTSAKDATGGYVGLTLFKINFKNVLNTFTSFFTNSNTAARTYLFPDKDGTVAMTSDITVKRVIRDTTTTGAVTGTAANTLCASYLVSGGVNVVGDILQIAFRTIKTNNNGTYTIRLYVNTSSSLSGATLLGTYTTGSVTTVTTEFGRYLAIKSSTNTEVSPSAVASVYPLNAYNAVVTNANIDHTSDKYYIVGIQPSGSNADVISNSWFSMISL